MHAFQNILVSDMQFVHKALELTSALSLDIFEMQPSTTLYFLLGPSALRPTEIYALSCGATAHAATEPDDRPAEVARDISRKVLRSLIINTAAVPEGKASVGALLVFSSFVALIHASYCHACTTCLACSGLITFACETSMFCA